MTERRYFNVDPDRRSKFWNFNGTAFQILELELNGGQFGSIDLFPLSPYYAPFCLQKKKINSTY